MSNTNTPLLQQQMQQHQQHHQMDPNREVEVWVRDANGLRCGVRIPISSTFNNVMKKVRQEHGYFQFEGVVGFEDGWNEFTTILQMFPTPRPNNFNEEQYLRDNPIRPKFKKVRNLNLQLSNESL
jgi:hypothetical protein